MSEKYHGGECKRLVRYPEILYQDSLCKRCHSPDI